MPLQIFNRFRLHLNWLRKHKFFVVSILYWLFCGLIPLAVIISEFGTNKGLLYAKFYSPLYFYPLIFGFIAVYFMLRPISFLFGLEKSHRFNLRRRDLLVFILTMTLMISILEFNGNPAIWEVKESAIIETINGLNSSNTSRNINNENEFIAHFINPPLDPVDDRLEAAVELKRQKEEIAKTREEFNEIITVASKKIQNWSITKYFYFVSFIIQLAAVFFEFIAISFMSIPKFRDQYLAGLDEDSPQRKSREAQLRKYLILLSCSLTFTLAWLYMRIPFDADKTNLYGIGLISISASTIVIGSVYVISMIYITIRLLFTYGETFQVVLNVISASAGILATYISVQATENILGSDATLQNYASMAIATAIVLYPWYVAYRDLLDE